MAKLVEILARELKEWPEEAVAIAQDEDWCAHPYNTAALRIVDRGWEGAYGSAVECANSYNVNLPMLAEDYATAIVTRTEWQAAVDALNKQWDGSGLPPVGGPYEYNDNFAWCTCDVIAYANAKVVFVRPDYPDAVYVAGRDEISFRPIRTPEQIAAEERDKAIKDLYYTINWNDNATQWEYVSANRKADYAKAIDAGYRKQEQK